MSEADQRAAERGPFGPEPLRRAQAAAWHGSFLGFGTLAIAAQVLLLRELMVALAGDESVLGVGLACWLGGIALGARLARRFVTTGRRGATWGLALLALAAPIAVIAARLLRWGLAPPAGELPGLGSALACAGATLAPCGALVGWCFTALASAAADSWRSGTAIARLYITESLGALTGGVLVTFVVIPRLAPLTGALLAGILALILVLPALWARLLAGRRSVLALLAVLVLALGAAGPLERWTERVRFAGTAPGITLRSFTDTPYQHLAVGGDDVRHVYSSGQYVTSFPDPYGSESLAHLLACLAPSPARVLALGGLELGSLRFLLRHPVERLTLVEADRAGFDFLVARLPPEDRTALADSRVRVVHDDPRQTLVRSRESFDLMLVLEPDPLTLLRARLTTAEFYALCAARLADDGVLIVALRTSPNVLTGATAALGGSLWRALESAFQVVRATPGPEGLLVAGTSERAVSLDAQVLADRWRERGLTSEVFAAELLPLLLPAERIRNQEAALRAAAEHVEASRDDRPVSFLHALARRQDVTRSRLGRWLGALARFPPGALVALTLLPSVVSIVLLRRRSDARVVAAEHAVAVVGAAGMTWSLLILFAFQTRVGVLYGQLGLLTAAFMLGLALGSYATRTSASEREGGAVRSDRAFGWLTAASALAFGYALALSPALRLAGTLAETGPLPAVTAYAALLVVAGCLTGALFPPCAGVLIQSGLSARETAGRLESADHAGAGLAALVSAVLLIPALGAVATGWLVAALLGLALAAVLLARRAN